MSDSRRASSVSSDIGIEALSDRLRNSVRPEMNKPDFRELDLGSPVSPLRTVPTTSSSSSSSGSLSGRNGAPKSAELSGSVESSPSPTPTPTARAPFNRSGGSCVNSPPPSNAFPTGNICPSGRILKTGMASRASKTDVLGSGTGNYGHGSIIRGGFGTTHKPTNLRGSLMAEETQKKETLGNDPEELKRIGNENYKKGNFAEALNLYDKAISISPGNAAYHCNRAAALIGLKRLVEAVRECEEAIRLDPRYVRAHHRLGSLFLSLGQVENARRHICLPGHQLDHLELRKLEAVEKHIEKCNDARGASDWRSVLREADAAIASGADASPQLFACRVEALAKLHQLDNADSSLSKVPKIESTASFSQSKIFGMLSEAYVFFVRAQIELAHGRFESALAAIERAKQIDCQNVEVSVLLNNVRLVTQARTRGNDLFKSERFTEACAAYGEGLSLQLERWAEAVRDYEALRSEFPHDTKVAESLFHAQVALKKSRGKRFIAGNLVEISINKFSQGKLPNTMGSVHFLGYAFIMLGNNVDVEDSPAIGTAENIMTVPMFKIYKNGSQLKELVCPSPEELESLVRHWAI
nr:TPR repeat-containing thioredoxin TTL1-like [Ipomoea batatas]